MEFQGQDSFLNAKLNEPAPGGPYLVGAYAVVLAVLALYVLSLWRRISRVEREVVALNARLKR